ncbi:hypothetical protein [Methanobrevibacter curvatus]|uniref:hypothetical protein n=1 Tax=Methanobrevibacter curvatus TaxID=49547 RepID=UPI000833E1EC|nr:hypothetical protein [Methanobrevibacter curvatus]
MDKKDVAHKMGLEYQKKMYEILKLYFEDYDPKYTIICVNKKHKPLIGDIKEKIPMKTWMM